MNSHQHHQFPDNVLSPFQKHVDMFSSIFKSAHGEKRALGNTIEKMSGRQSKLVCRAPQGCSLSESASLCKTSLQNCVGRFGAFVHCKTMVALHCRPTHLMYDVHAYLPDAHPTNNHWTPHVDADQASYASLWRDIVDAVARSRCGYK